MKTEFIALKERINFDDSLLRNNGYNPYYVSIGSEQKDPLLVNGKEVINLATNNYLGLANDERIKETYIETIRKYGVSMCATPIAGGYTELFEQTKIKLADFIGVEKVLLYPSCYQANNGIFLAVAGKDDLILFDRFVHSSLIQGIRSVGCKALPFGHNNPESLENLLKRYSEYLNIFVVTESVFSTEGSIAPFRQICELCLKYKAIPVVDDSHGIGIIGNSGKGILSHFELEKYDGIYTASLGKAMVNNCGVVGGSKELIKYLSYWSPHLIYSTALMPAIIAGINKTIDIVLDEFETRKKRIYQNTDLIKNALTQRGYKITDSKTPITSVISGSSEETLNFAKNLFSHSILSTPFVYPSVKKNEGRVRLISGANLKESTIDRVLTVIKNFKLN